MKRKVIISVAFAAVFAFPLSAQTDSSEVAQPAEQVVVVTLDSKTDGRLESIDQSAKPYSLEELIRLPKGLDSVNLNFWIAAVTLFFCIMTFIAQRKTEKHTKNVPIKDQQGKFRDLSRHEYRNLCCALAAAIKYFDLANGTEKNRLAYPSESNLKKLKVQPEDIVLSIDSDVSALITEVRLLLRNYNIEIDVASQHLSRKNINDSTIIRDFDNLFFKPMFLVKGAYRLELTLVNRKTLFFRKKKLTQDRLLTRTIITIATEHFRKIWRSLPRYMDENDLRFFHLLGTVNDLSFPGVDHTSAISRSVDFLISGGNTRSFGIDDLDDEIHLLINDTFDYLSKMKDDHPVEYKLLNHYEDIIAKLKDKKVVDFRDFLSVALPLDAIVETMNIGMVNYE